MERQQLKWFAYTSLGVVLTFVLSAMLSTVFPGMGELRVDLLSYSLTLGWPVARSTWTP